MNQLLVNGTKTPRRLNGSQCPDKSPAAVGNGPFKAIRQFPQENPILMKDGTLHPLITLQVYPAYPWTSSSQLPDASAAFANNPLTPIRAVRRITTPITRPIASDEGVSSADSSLNSSSSFEIQQAQGKRSPPRCLTLDTAASNIRNMMNVTTGNSPSGSIATQPLSLKTYSGNPVNRSPAPESGVEITTVQQSAKERQQRVENVQKDAVTIFRGISEVNSSNAKVATTPASAQESLATSPVLPVLMTPEQARSSNVDRSNIDHSYLTTPDARITAGTRKRKIQQPTPEIGNSSISQAKISKMSSAPGSAGREKSMAISQLSEIKKKDLLARQNGPKVSITSFKAIGELNLKICKLEKERKEDHKRILKLEKEVGHLKDFIMKSTIEFIKHEYLNDN